MKKIILFILLCCTIGAVKAQKLEFNFNAGTGLFNYTGAGSNTSSYLIGNEGTTDNANNYINNPYGRKATFSYTGNLDLKWVTKNGFLIGTEAGYQFLRSKTDLNSVFRTDIYYVTLFTVNSTPYVYTYPARGSSVLTNQYININPYIGYRFNLGKFSMDAMPGLSFGIATLSREKGKAILTDQDENNTFYDNLRLNKPKNDTRITLNVAFNFNKWGIVAGYMHGVRDFNRNQTSLPAYYGTSTIPQHVYSQLFSAGLYYRIK